MLKGSHHGRRVLFSILNVFLFISNGLAMLAVDLASGKPVLNGQYQCLPSSCCTRPFSDDACSCALPRCRQGMSVSSRNQTSRRSGCSIRSADKPTFVQKDTDHQCLGSFKLVVLLCSCNGPMSKDIPGIHICRRHPTFPSVAFPTITSEVGQTRMKVAMLAS